MSGSNSKRFYTYLHYRLDTMQVFYVGKGRHDRASWTYGRSQHWQRVARKHGFSVEIASEWPTEAEAFEHEIFLIDTLKAMGHPLVNVTVGGEGPAGLIHSEEARRRMSESAKRRRRPAEENEKRSASMKAAWASAGHRERMAAAISAFSSTDEYRAKISAASKRMWESAEYRSRVLAAKQATLDSIEFKEASSVRRAKRMSDPSYRERLSRSHGTRRFVCHETGEVFASQSIAAEQLGISKPKLCLVLSGKRRSTGGYTFSFIEPRAPASPQT